MRDTLIPLDTYVHPWGKVTMVRLLDGERYYWFVDYNGCVSMMPACAVEHTQEQ